MIAVIADDFTGAAELGGVGLLYGLTVEIQAPLGDLEESGHHIYPPNFLNVSRLSGMAEHNKGDTLNLETTAELLIIDTNSRCMPANYAARETAKSARKLTEVAIEWMYKKTDSLMRGHISLELHALLKGLHLNRALLVPANPSLGRKIISGDYIINGKLLHKSEFSSDPEYEITTPLQTSNVIQLLGPSKILRPVILREPESIPENSIAIGEAASKEDLVKWTSILDERLIPAGAGEFFDAILEAKGYVKQLINAPKFNPAQKNVLIICGCKTEKSRSFVQQLKKQGMPVCEIPCSLASMDELTKECLQRWSTAILKALEHSPFVTAALRQPAASSPEVVRKLTQFTADVVEAVFQHNPIKELFIEGGSTASAILRRLGWKRLVPLQVLAPGVIRMAVKGSPKQYVTVKPGSYAWPEKMWDF